VIQKPRQSNDPRELRWDSTAGRFDKESCIGSGIMLLLSVTNPAACYICRAGDAAVRSGSRIFRKKYDKDSENLRTMPDMQWHGG